MELSNKTYFQLKKSTERKFIEKERYLAYVMSKVAKIHFAAEPVNSSSLLSFCVGAPLCFFKQGMCQWPSTVCNMLLQLELLYRGGH